MRPGDSTINQLLSITDERYRAFEDYDETRALFLDISKAFDKVWHEGLILKLRQFGFCGDILSLPTNFLKDRQQRVVLDGLEYYWQSILSVFLQGSVLGPLLFLVYINELTIFAGDSDLTTAFKMCN